MAALLVEQGLRLASLVHDLGHLPFSHDFEQALEDHWRARPEERARAGSLVAQGPGGDQVHERIGYALAHVVQQDVFEQRLSGGPFGKPAEVALLVARDILDAPAAPELDADEHAPVLSWLHSLVAGEVDVDRADYVLSDGLHYGLVAAGYDLDRLVDVYMRKRATRIVDLLGMGAEPLPSFLNDLERIASGAADDATVDRFVDYDDGWWTGLMRNRLREGVAPSIEPWLALFVRRRPGPVSLWKRAADFPAQDRAAWNASLPTNEDFSLLTEWQRIRAELRGDGILIERLPFRPWRADPDGESALQIHTPGGLVPLTRLSPLVRALGTAWGEELQVLAFADTADRTTPADVLARLQPALQL